ncbi:organic hydroperoxide resistance protein [Streptomyces sp. NPDC001922]|uniref:organic hydroperoxide resistance protein n=1 Tax=Streptomyces sp. NPDC001922 TaxID=3364624 RepID=UPI00369ABE8B
MLQDLATAAPARSATSSPIRPTEIVYLAEATAHGGRDGFLRTPDGQLDVRVGIPRELGGDGVGTNPEQLFAAGWSACFHSALALVGERAGHDLTTASVSAKVGLGPTEADAFGFDVALRVSLPLLDQALAERFVAEARQVCPFSNATRGNIDVSIMFS